MTRKKNTDSGVYRFLELSGVLDTGSPEDIAQKRKEYWCEKKRQWKREKRKKETEFKIYLDSIELPLIAKSAKSQGLSRTRYIKQAALAFANNQHVVADRATTNHILRLLELNCAFLQDLVEQLPATASHSLQERMQILEQQIFAALGISPT